MSLQPDQFTSLHLALVGAFVTESEVEELTLAQGLHTTLNHITPSATLPGMLVAVIRHFEGRGLSRELVTAAMAQRPRDVTMQEIGRSILACLDAMDGARVLLPADRYEACLIGPGRSFIARQTLRTFMRNVSDPGGHSILAVNGVSSMGKSYSMAFITFLKHSLRGFDVFWVDLGDETAGDYKPEDLVRAIALQLAWNADTLKPSSRFAKDAVRWIIGQWNQRQDTRPLIIVLDNFHAPELYGQTRELVQELIRQVAANTSLVRLVLLNYGRDLLPPGIGPMILHEPVIPLSRPELVDFFRSVAKLTGQKDPPAAVIESSVDHVLAKVPAETSPRYNEVVNQRATEAATRLLR